ncbi:MAG: LpqN/LpqT family lipoprotein [Mycobacterium sp.]
MKKFTSVAGAGVTALALGLALVGCGSNSDTEATGSSETTSAEETTGAEDEEAAPTETSDAALPAGPNQTIPDFIRQNGLQESAVRRGDPGPTVNIPVPAGWRQTDQLPEAPYGAIVYPESAVPNNPPRILALMSKLTGDFDPAEILDYAPGELENMPGYQGANDGVRDTLSGFESVQLGGTYEIDGKKGMIAQKTVVIPAEDGAYVLQLNAYSDESESSILAEATNIIDAQTTIAP